MMILRCTQKLLKDMKAAPIEVEDGSALFSWHGNLMQLNKKYILFVNNQTQLAVILEGVRSGQADKLADKFKAQLTAYLLQEGIKEHHIQQYFLEAGEAVFARTNSKSVIGSMNEMVQYSLVGPKDEFPSLFRRNQFLNKLIYKPIDYHKPIDVFRETITSRYS